MHVTGVREHMVDMASADDFAALGRVMDAVVDQLAAGRARGRHAHRRLTTPRTTDAALRVTG